MVFKETEKNKPLNELFVEEINKLSKVLFEDPVIEQYVKDIENLSKKVEGSIKKLEEQTKKLLDYDPNPIRKEAEDALEQLNQQVAELNKKLKDFKEYIGEKYINHSTIDLIEMIAVQDDVRNVVDKVEKIINEEAKKAINRFRGAIHKFNEGLNDPYIRWIIMNKLRA